MHFWGLWQYVKTEGEGPHKLDLLWVPHSLRAKSLAWTHLLTMFTYSSYAFASEKVTTQTP